VARAEVEKKQNVVEACYSTSRSPWRRAYTSFHVGAGRSTAAGTARRRSRQWRFAILQPGTAGKKLDGGRNWTGEVSAGRKGTRHGTRLYKTAPGDSRRPQLPSAPGDIPDCFFPERHSVGCRGRQCQESRSRPMGLSKRVARGSWHAAVMPDGVVSATPLQAHRIGDIYDFQEGFCMSAIPDSIPDVPIPDAPQSPMQ
jgi:hypothetical protein